MSPKCFQENSIFFHLMTKTRAGKKNKKQQDFISEFQRLSFEATEAAILQMGTRLKKWAWSCKWTSLQFA